MKENSERRIKAAIAPKGSPCRRGRYKCRDLDNSLICATFPRFLAPGITTGCVVVVVVIVCRNAATSGSVVGASPRASITMSCSTVVTGYRLSVSCSFATIATDPVSKRSAEEVETRAGFLLEEGFDTGTDVLLEEGLDIDSELLLGGDLDIDSDNFREELNTGSGFIRL